MRTTTVSSGLITTQALTSGKVNGPRRPRRVEAKSRAERQSAAKRRCADDETATVE
jgi:hypothetical protein